jgi:dTMP kinase
VARGRLIVFEGAEGAGKTTQLRLLAERLTANGVKCIAVREPGGTPVGDVIRDLLLDPEANIAPEAEALLFMASRAELVAREIRPNLERGVTVIVDRFFLSTYAYQIFGRGLAEESVRAANALATSGVVPDITILLEVPVDLGMKRADTRGSRDRMERSGTEFHRRVSEAFSRFAKKEWQVAHPECGQIIAVRADDDESTVFARVADLLAEQFPQEFQLLRQFSHA